MQQLALAGLNIDVEGTRLGNNFQAFEKSRSEGAADIRAALCREALPPLPETGLQARPQEWIYSFGDLTHYRYEGDSLIAGMVYDTTHASYTLYEAAAQRNDAVRSSEEILVNGMSHMLRGAVIEQLSLRDGLLLHSAGIEHKGRAIAFSAPSQTGKSTHTAMWVEQLGATVIDGDNCAVRLNGGKPRLYGLPWCGTSGLFQNTSVPLEAIVFLEQAPENELVELTAAEKVLRLTARCYLPHWAGYNAVSRCMDIAEKLVLNTRMCLLRCRPDLAAMETVRQWIEQKMG